MKTFLTNIKAHFQVKRLSTVRITILGMFLALMIALKYLLGFIPGIELISFFFIIFGIFLPVVDLLLLISAFNFLILALYGFGLWWIAYWIIWPLDAFVAKGLSKITKNYLIFGLWGFFAGFLVFFWYFWIDFGIYGFNYALLNVISALPLNLIEGLFTMVMVIILGPLLAKVFAAHSHFWKNKKQNWNFTFIKKGNWNFAITASMILLAIILITLLVIYNPWFLDLKAMLFRGNLNQGLIGDGEIGNFAPTK